MSVNMMGPNRPNRQQRRSLARDMRKVVANRKTVDVRDRDEGQMIVDSGSPIPHDIKADVCRIARAIEFKGLPGGDCFFRTAIGYVTLIALGFRPELAIGGLLYRVGPDPVRDVVAFCGPGNAGQMLGGHFLGHLWLQAYDEIIDFSCGDWHRVSAREAEVAIHGVDRAMPEPVWTVRAPTFVWADKKLFGWSSVGTPELGAPPWYTPWRGDPPHSTLLDDLFEQGKIFLPVIAENLKASSLPQRLKELGARHEISA